MKESCYSRSTSESSAHGALQSFYGKLREKAIAINDMKPQGMRKRKAVCEGEFFYNTLKETVFFNIHATRHEGIIDCALCVIVFIAVSSSCNIRTC